MNCKPSLFILGAGASKDHGFPTGNELLNSIINVLDENTPLISTKLHAKLDNKVVLSILVGLFIFDNNSMSPNQTDFIEIVKIVLKFHQRIKDSSSRSIDDFLNAQLQNEEDDRKKKFINVLGKMLIVIALVKYENNSINNNYSDLKKDDFKNEPFKPKNKFFKERESFFTSFWQHIYGNSCKEFLSNLKQVNFITFNYDRLLEHFIYSRVHSMYPNDASELKEEIDIILKSNVYHFYGRLAPLNWEDASGVEFGSLSFNSLNDLFLEQCRYFNQMQPGPPTGKLESYGFQWWTIFFVIRKEFLGRQEKQNPYNFDLLEFIFKSITSIYTYNESVSHDYSEQGTLYEHVYFLGFSFNRLNMEGLGQILELEPSYKAGAFTQFFGTVKGMNLAEVFEAEKLINKYILNYGPTPTGHNVRLQQLYDQAKDLNIPMFFKTFPDVRYI